MIYHINTNGDIVGMSKENPNGKVQRLGAGVINVQHDLLEFPQNYRYVDGAFVEREFVPYTISQAEIFIDDVVSIEVPAETQVTISGPSTYQSGVADGSIEFSTEIAGEYSFKLIAAPYKQTIFAIKVEL